MSSYAGLAALKQTLGLDDTDDDGLLTSCIVRASGAIDGFLERNRVGFVGFANSSNTRTSVGSSTRVYDGTATETLFIDDAQTVAAVSVDAVSITSNSWRLWPYNENPKRAVIYADPIMDRVGLTTDTWTVGTANVAVTGYFGLDHVPSEVEQACLAVAVILWRRYQEGNPEPVVNPDGVRGYVTEDPEIQGLLATILQGWIVPGVWGG